jgi:phosphatidylglycerol:prolipoprotein diacylglycerol transferase
LIAPSLVAGLALGRIGCLLNGCCYGGVSQQPWAVTFPQGSLPYDEQVRSGRLYGFRMVEVETPGKKERQTEGGSVTVTWVAPNSAAARMGLAVGDQIVRLRKYNVQNVQLAHDELSKAIQGQAPLEILTRSGKMIRLPAVGVSSRSLPVHPTQLYSAIHAGLLSWFLWSYYPFRRRDGEVFALLITIYPVARFLLEIIRIDESSVFGTGLSISQNISLVLLAGAVSLWIYLLRKPAGNLVFSGE